MTGALFGDIVGSVYEFRPVKTADFPLFSHRSCFTDDTVLTVATADALISGAGYGKKYREYYRLYPDAGYGGMFHHWAGNPSAGPYGSYGNGSAMRVSPIGYAFGTLDEVLREAERSAAVTHNHPEGIRGAQAVAAAVFLARTGTSKEELRRFLETRFSYDLSRRLDDIRPSYGFDVTCQGSVPESLLAFFESDSCEDAVRKAVSLGGDADTMGCIAGAVAQAFYGLPADLEKRVLGMLTPKLREVTVRFRERYE